MKKIISILVVVLLLVSIVGCDANKQEVNKGGVKIGYLPITHSLPLYIEKQVEKGDIELVKFGSWPELMDALNSGEIDGASVLIELAMKAKANGIDLKAVALGHKDGNAVVVDQSINSVEDLKGKTFAIPSKLSSHNILTYKLLQEKGLKLSDINIVELAPTEMPVALAEKRISGYCVAEPFGAKSVVSGNAKTLKQSSEIIPDSICCAFVLRGDFIKNNNDKAKEIVSKYKEAAKYIEDNKEESNKLAKEYLNVQDNVLDLSLEWISFDNLRIEKKDYDRLTTEINELKLIENTPSYEDFVDNSLYDGVN